MSSVSTSRGAHRHGGARGSGEGDDRAFWISYSDLMTALMVLFMMVMAVALMAITRPGTARSASPAAERADPAPAAAATPASTPPGEAQALALLSQEIAEVVRATPGVHFDARRLVIDFGDRARFATGSHQLDAQSARLLREFTPRLLAVVNQDPMRDWVQRIVVEGFADPRGDYLFNLNLSLQRAQRVLCTLLDPTGGEQGLNLEQRMQVRDLFSVGGFSFNDQRDSMDASRRIELRVELGPRPPAPAVAGADIGSCRLPA